jgi:hypothetical protein
MLKMLPARVNTACGSVSTLLRVTVHRQGCRPAAMFRRLLVEFFAHSPAELAVLTSAANASAGASAVSAGPVEVPRLSVHASAGVGQVPRCMSHTQCPCSLASSYCTLARGYAAFGYVCGVPWSFVQFASVTTPAHRTARLLSRHMLFGEDTKDSLMSPYLPPSTTAISGAGSADVPQGSQGAQLPAGVKPTPRFLYNHADERNAAVLEAFKDKASEEGDE